MIIIPEERVKATIATAAEQLCEAYGEMDDLATIKRQMEASIIYSRRKSK